MASLSLMSSVELKLWSRLKSSLRFAMGEFPSEWAVRRPRRSVPRNGFYTGFSRHDVIPGNIVRGLLVSKRFSYSTADKLTGVVKGSDEAMVEISAADLPYKSRYVTTPFYFRYNAGYNAGLFFSQFFVRVTRLLPRVRIFYERPTQKETHPYRYVPALYL
jgi:hypothetical protein